MVHAMVRATFATGSACTPATMGTATFPADPDVTDYREPETNSVQTVPSLVSSYERSLTSDFTLTAEPRPRGEAIV
nr:hypothetical protein GCM10010200_112600 [Actinomadura rugatobispora]